MPKNEPNDTYIDSDNDYQFEPRESDEETLWEVIEIVAEKPKVYKVRWAGLNPKTRKPWPMDWVPRSDCTPELVNAWKLKKLSQKKAKPSKGKASAKSKEKEASSSKGKSKEASPSKGKSKEKEVIPSDSESELKLTRPTRTYGREKSVSQPKAGEQCIMTLWFKGFRINSNVRAISYTSPK